jgi:hypothetical protein
MFVLHRAMATTKRAQFRFKVKEGATEAREVREGVIDMIADPFIVAEPCGKEPASDLPLENPDFLSFDLREGVSLGEAERIVDFLNEHLLAIAITTFADAEEVIRDVKQSGRVQRIEAERFSLAVTDLRKKVSGGNSAEITEALRAVEFIAADLLKGWSKAVAMSKAIMETFGEGENNPDA